MAETPATGSGAKERCRRLRRQERKARSVPDGGGPELELRLPSYVRFGDVPVLEDVMNLGAELLGVAEPI